jgi:DNA-binding XRE family transcriptional regulator
MNVKKDYSHLAKKIREIRNANHLTMEEMGWRLGTYKSSVSMWESGKARPNSKRCRMIADMGGISLDELYGSNPDYDEMVNRPDHYTWKKKECREIQRDMVDGLSGMAANDMGNIIKYLYRVGHKDDIKQDLDKAKQFIDFLYEDLKKVTN